MTTKPYKTESNPSGKVSEPMVSYAVTEKVSLNDLGISSNTFNNLVERAETDFANGQYISATDLLHKIKQQRGWL